MADLSLRHRTLRTVAGGGGALARVYAGVFFSRSRITGALLLLATATDPGVFAHGLAAVVSAWLMMRLLGIDPAQLADGPYGCNALLVGLGVAHAYALGIASLCFAVAASSASVFVTAGLRSLVMATTALPILSLPFVATITLASAFAPFAGLVPTGWTADPADGLPPSVSFALQCLGAIFFMPRVLPGAFALLAMLAHSRIAMLLAGLGLLVARALMALAPWPVDASLAQLLAFNAMLTAVALGGAWFVPSPSSVAIGVGGAAFSVPLTVGLSSWLAHLGLAPWVLPFNATVLLVLVAMRQRTRDRSPKSVDFAPGSPEQNLAYYRTRVERFDAPYPIAFRLPFRGAWKCTQGVDGEITHRGPWRHAFDFEVCGDDGSFFKGDGGRVEKHHCHGLPVLAAADGTVVRVVNDVPNNAIGEVDLERNWGNLVMLLHTAGLYSLVAHLSPGSARVCEGQRVRRGELLGHCGSSGRSPRPHLHFQLQSSARLGAPTLPCRFQSVIVRSSTERLESSLTPRLGDAVRNVDPDDASTYFAFERDSSLRLRCGDRTETIEHDIDLVGNRILRSRDHDASLYFARTDEGFTVYEVLGSRRSLLHLLRKTLPRVPFDRNDSLEWADSIGWWRAGGGCGPATRWLLDFVAPFTAARGLVMTYRARREGSLLVVTGESRIQRAGAPVLRTRAALSRTGGEIVLEEKRGALRRTASWPVPVRLGYGSPDLSRGESP